MAINQIAMKEKTWKMWDQPKNSWTWRKKIEIQKQTSTLSKGKEQHLVWTLKHYRMIQRLKAKFTLCMIV